MVSSTDYYTVYPSSLYTIVYTTHDGRTVYERYVRTETDKPLNIVRQFEESELELGDTAAIDNFLGGFSHAKE